MLPFWESFSPQTIRVIMQAHKRAIECNARAITLQHLLPALLEDNHLHEALKNLQCLKQIETYEKCAAQNDKPSSVDSFELMNKVVFDDNCLLVLKLARKAVTDRSAIARIYPEDVLLAMAQSNQVCLSENFDAAELQKIPLRSSTERIMFGVQLLSTAVSEAREMKVVVIEPVHFLLSLFRIEPMVLDRLGAKSFMSHAELVEKTKTVISRPVVPFSHFSLESLKLLRQILRLKDHDSLNALLILLKSKNSAVKIIVEESTHIDAERIIQSIILVNSDK